MGSSKLNKKCTKDNADLSGLPLAIRLQVSQNMLTPAERKAAKYFMKNREAVFLSITEVVEDSGLGYGTIIRFVQRLGYAGFQEFKVLLAQEMGALTRGSSEEDGLAHDAIAYSQKMMSNMRATETLFNEQTLIAVAKRINEAKRVLITGIAGSASVALGLDYHLSRLGINCSAVCDGYNLAIRAASLSREDVFFAISFSGATKDVLSAAEIAKRNGATTVSLTNFIHAPLVDLSDYNLFASTDRDPLSCEIFPNCAAAFVLDVLFNYVFKSRQGAKEAVEKTFAAISDRRV